MGINRVNNNITGFNPSDNLRNLNRTQRQILQSMERLSSGFRINRAADDAAGLSVSNRLRSQIQGMNEAYNGLQSGINMINTADQGMSGVTERLGRIRDLVVQSGNTGVLDQQGLQTIQNEINQNVDEIGRIANTTQFGSNNLLNGDFAPTAGVRPGTPDRGVEVDESSLTTRENFFNIRTVREGSATAVAGDEAGQPQVMNTGIANQQDIAVTTGTMNVTATGAEAGAAENLTNVSFNGADLEAGGTISFRGVLADGETEFSGTFQISAGTDIAGGGGADTSLADTIQSAIDAAEEEAGINTAGGTNAAETNVNFNATTGRFEFANGAEQGTSNFDIGFTVENAAGDLQNTTGVTRAADMGGQVGNAVDAITGSTFETGELSVEVSNVVAAQERTVESNMAFETAGGGAVTESSNLIGSVFNGATLAQGDTIEINGTNPDGTTFNNTITISTVDGGVGNGAAVTFGDLMDELNNRDQSTAAGGTGNQSGFTEATANLTGTGTIQVVDDLAAESQTNFTLTVNDNSAGGGTFNTVSDSAQLVREGNEQMATVSVNGGPAQQVTAGEETTLYGNPEESGQPAPQITMTFGELSEGTDTINNTRAAFTGSLNGGPEVRFEAGEQDVQFTSGARPGETVTLDFDAQINAPGPDEEGLGTVVISATGREANFQTGAFAGQAAGVTFGDLRPENLGLGEGRSLNDIDITEEGGVEEALNIIDEALNQVNSARGNLGAFSNRLEASANELSVASENMMAANSRLTDAGFARESTRLATNQMILDANIAVQSQMMNLQGNMFIDLLR